MIITLCRYEDSRPMAIIPADEKRTRNALLAVIPFDEDASMPTLVVDY